MTTKKKGECVVFHSYKGGTGKTLTTLQMASILTHIGKSVCLVDFDLEAPGLVSRVGALGNVDPAQFLRASGVVDYVYEFALQAVKRNWLVKCSCGEFRWEEGPEDKSLPLRSVFGMVMSVPTGTGGADLFLLPAGALVGGHESYWTKLFSPQVRAILDDRHWSKALFSAMLQGIRQELDVDYVLVDSRSGVNEFSGICTKVLADKVVMLTCLNQEAFLGMQQELKGICLPPDRPPVEENDRLPIRSTESIFITFSRIPDLVEDASGRLRHIRRPESSFALFPDSIDWADIQRSALKAINPAERVLHFKDSWVLASEPLLEVFEGVPLQPGQGAGHATQLACDFLTLAGAVFPDERGKLKKLRESLGEVRELRPYYIVKGVGAFINPDDNSPNVAFKVDTFNATLSDFYRSFVELTRREGHGAVAARAAAAEALFRAGESAASRFGTYLVEELFKGGGKGAMTTRDKIDAWCRFDSTVGFGHFRPEILDTRTMEGGIWVESNFLVRNRPPGEPNLCAFLGGYISRVLSAIFAPHKVKVSHDLKTECGQRGTGRTRRDCLFRFSVVPNKKEARRS